MRAAVKRDRTPRGVDRLVESADQQKIANLEIACLCGVGVVTLPREHAMRRIERIHQPADVARNERYLGLGDRPPHTSNGLPRTEGASRTLQ